MSIFYDPHSKRPQWWTFVIFFIVTAAVFLAIYLYGEHKAKGLPMEEQKNAIFEDRE